MTRPLDIGGELADEALPIVHPDRTIGDTVELVPGNAPGDFGPVKEILRTRGGDDSAQLLTITVVGAGVYESSLRGASSAPRGPLVGFVEWGVRGAKARAEFDIPQGGVTFSLVASYLHVAARYDGLVLVNGAQLDPEATGGANPGPKQRVGAMVGYGSYGASAKLTRTVRVDDVPFDIVDGPTASRRVRVPPFARRVLVAGNRVDGASYRLGFGTLGASTNGDALFGVGQGSRYVDLPGDAAFVEVLNLGPGPLTNPAIVFELGL
ncbi:MAG: hypothetical protein SFX73_08370 [Kofleriaceae bacterium]|nr:hypothetical protein [Kofleriaceae bacterium]